MANEPALNGCATIGGLTTKFSSEEALKFAKKLYIHGGNISNWNRIKRKTTPSAADELSESIGTTLSSGLLPVNNNEQEFIPFKYIPVVAFFTFYGYTTNAQRDQLPDELIAQLVEHCTGIAEKKVIRCVNRNFVEKIERAEREHLKITVKVFAVELKPAIIQDALFRAMCELGVESVDTLFLALPEDLQGEEDLNVLKGFWEEMECLLDSGYVDSLGVCDLNKSTLEKLYEWARVKPLINQVNLASCCVMPKDLVAFSEKHEIQLLTHADPKDILTKESLHEVLTEGCENVPVQGWRPVWALRYSVLVKCRGVIKNKGYIVSCEQD